MNINKLIERLKYIVLDKMEFKGFYVGNVWDNSQSKGDKYPCTWMEFPVLVDYKSVGKHTKEFTFSMDFLVLPKMDDLEDEINKISDIEQYVDLFLQYLKKDTDFPLIETSTGISVKAFNADNACGIRLDVKVNTGRYCPEDKICYDAPC